MAVVETTRVTCNREHDAHQSHRDGEEGRASETEVYAAGDNLRGRHNTTRMTDSRPDALVGG